MLRITVKSYMTQKSTPLFDFMEKWNNNIPMPLRVMYGTKLEETKGMVKMQLHGDILANEGPLDVCMKCGRPITNTVSRYFGLGPVCGQHNYVNPFDTEEELQEAVAEYRKTLKNITWTGWIIKSAIISEEKIDDEDEPEVKVRGSVSDEPEEFVINVRTGKSKKVVSEHSAFISFRYNRAAVDCIKQLDERSYNPDTKEWEIPYAHLDKFIEKRLSSAMLQEGFNVTVTVKDDARLQDRTEVDIPKDFEFFTEPMPHQLEGIKYGLNHERWLLGDSQGLGKTKQIIDLARILHSQGKVFHCLVICGVNNLKWNWKKEISKHGHQGSHILGYSKKVSRRIGTKSVIGGTKDKLADLQKVEDGEIKNLFLITNIESLRIAKLADKISELCSKGVIDMVVIDESHKAKNSFSLQGSGLLKIESKYRISVSGTPMLNSPLDLYTTFKWLGFEPYSFYSFRKHFCQMGGYNGAEILGYKNMDQLQSQLNRIMLRRTKADVLSLPEKRYIDDYVEMGAPQTTVYYQIKSQLLADIDKIKASANPLSMMMRLRQATGYTGIVSSAIQESAKFERAREIVEDAVADDKKVVIFSNWTQMIYPAVEYLQDFNPVVITGDVKDAERPEIADRFQHDESVKVILGTTSAMGTGLTLTAGSVIIFLDEPASDALREQAIDRCHRIGTHQAVDIHMLMVPDTIDDRIHSLCDKKGVIFANVVDDKELPESMQNRIIRNSSDLVDFLLS